MNPFVTELLHGLDDVKVYTPSASASTTVTHLAIVSVDHSAPFSSFQSLCGQATTTLSTYLSQSGNDGFARNFEAEAAKKGAAVTVRPYHTQARLLALEGVL